MACSHHSEMDEMAVLTKVLGEKVMVSLMLGELKGTECQLIGLDISGHVCCGLASHPW